MLSPDKKDTEVSTTIVFARLKDFSSYMEKDPYGLLFARNVRLSLGSTSVNKDIATTFEKAPSEFVFSNNGITMLCDEVNHDPTSGELTIQNPRVVNGAQTLHSIQNVSKQSPNARVMVRLIKVPIPSGSQVAIRNQQRRELINKISVRSNLQNPIKKWNLVANDEFQQEVARYFRQKKYFYERRKNEWNARKSQLRTVGVRRGPGIKRLTQLLASFLWDKRFLGPAIAKGGLSKLFEDEPYKHIRRVSPADCYQIFLLSDIIDVAIKSLAGEKKYIRNFKGHFDLTLFSLVVKALDSAKFRWGFEEQGDKLAEPDKKAQSKWKRLTSVSIDYIRKAFQKDARAYQKAEGIPLTLNNYFKSEKYIKRVLAAPTSGALKLLARELATW